MAEKEYIELERIEKFFDGIYDCADLTFEPNDHCCAPDDCAHCKWFETKNAIKKRILSIPAADVRPVVLCKDCMYAPSGTDGGEDGFALEWPHDEWPEDNPCPCKCDDEWYSYKPNPEFYCAHGKREES